MTANPLTLEHIEATLRRLACLYARAVDRNDPGLLETVLTGDVVLKGPGFSASGLAEACAIPAMLRQMYLATQHQVHNQAVTVCGNTAEGETYCTANHLLKPPVEGEQDAQQLLVWAIRYQDKFRCQHGQWRICARTLIVDWTETRAVDGIQGLSNI